MLVEIEQFVNWVRRRNSQARTWRDYGYDLKQFVKMRAGASLYICVIVVIGSYLLIAECFRLVSLQLQV